MKRRKLKRPVVYGLYALGFVMLLGTLYLIDGMFPTNSFNGINDDYVNVVCDETEIFVLNSFELEV